MKNSLIPIFCFGLLLNSVFAQSSSDRQGATTSTRHGKMLSIKIFVPAGEDVLPVGVSPSQPPPHRCEPLWQERLRNPVTRTITMEDRSCGLGNSIGDTMIAHTPAYIEWLRQNY